MTRPARGRYTPTMLYLIAALALLPTLALADVAGPAKVIDGDTIEVAGEQIRLHGIDAPEGRQTCRRAAVTWPCGAEAARALRQFIDGQRVTCRERDVDRYGRIVAVCHAGGQDLNGRLVAEGMAMAYRRYSTEYVDEEDAARATGNGLWAGRFIPPWEWRRGKRLPEIASDKEPAPATVQPEARACCKVCRKGEACGNSCIRRSYTCRKPPGCACDAQ